MRSTIEHESGLVGIHLPQTISKYGSQTSQVMSRYPPLVVSVHDVQRLLGKPSAESHDTHSVSAELGIYPVSQASQIVESDELYVSQLAISMTHSPSTTTIPFRHESHEYMCEPAFMSNEHVSQLATLPS